MPKASARAIRTPAASASTWQNALELSMRAAAAVGPKVGIPAAASASATPAASGASGPITARSTRAARAAATTADGSRGSPADHGDAAHACDRVAAGQGDDRRNPGLAGEPHRQRVLASTPAHQEDPVRGRRDGAHQPRPAASGRSSSITVWVRSGPTETSVIGTPARAASAAT